MPQTPEQRKEYYQEHKKEKKEYSKKYYEEHKQKMLEYREKNKERIQEYIKQYTTTEQGKKRYRINRWKLRGIISDDYDALYDKYINATECELCKTPITEGGGIYGKKHLDHDHETGKFRNILCGHCNTAIMRFK